MRAHCCGDSRQTGLEPYLIRNYFSLRKLRSRNDGKRPDGLTLLSWSHGRCLVWDFTCPDTLPISHLHRASIAACTVAVDAENRKRAKYTTLCDQYCFVSLAVETLGALGEEAATFFRDIGRRICYILVLYICLPFGTISFWRV